MTSTDTVFEVISHPPRRKINFAAVRVPLLCEEADGCFRDFAAGRFLTLRELKEARLVTSEKVGLEQIYRFTGRPLRVVFDWSSKYKRVFDPAGSSDEISSKAQGLH